MPNKTVGGYRAIHRGPREDLRLADDSNAPSFDSAWEANIERVFRVWLTEGIIAGYESQKIGTKQRGANRLLFLTNSNGNGAIGLDFVIYLPRTPQTYHGFTWSLYREPKPHGEGVFKVAIEVKGRMKKGGILRHLTDGQLQQLYDAETDHSSAIKLRRLREKYPDLITWVIGEDEYKEIERCYQDRCPSWE